MLEVRDLQVRYGSVEAVRGVSLVARAGDVTCVVGPNGAGKSSTMLAIAGALRQCKGEVLLVGEPVLGKGAEAIARRGLSLVPEGRGVFATLSVRENLQLGLRRGTSGSATMQAVFEQFPILRDRLSQPAGRLSGGEQQQLVIARALLTGPKVLLIDEPSLGLSPQMVELVAEAVRALKPRGVAALVVEQSAERALRMADFVYVMRNGKVTFAAPRAEIASADSLHAAYFGENQT